MESTLTSYVFNADDEEPDCMRCICCTECSYKYCEENCGPEHGWNGYQRIEAKRKQEDER